MSEKPEIEFQEGPPPTELVVTDLIVGDGAEAQPGGTVTVHYVGVDYETGEQFDASWDRGESISFPLRGLIQGWQDGIPGRSSATGDPAGVGLRHLGGTPTLGTHSGLRDRSDRGLSLPGTRL